MPADPAVPTPDVLAVERFRTVVNDMAGAVARDDVADQLVSNRFPSAQFVHDVNAAGVSVRRLVVHGEWEVDPNPPKPDPRMQEAVRVLGPSLTSPHDPYRTGARSALWRSQPEACCSLHDAAGEAERCCDDCPDILPTIVVDAGPQPAPVQIHQGYDRTVTILVNDEEVAQTDYDAVGWSGLDAVMNAARGVAKAAGLAVRETEGESRP